MQRFGLGKCSVAAMAAKSVDAFLRFVRLLSTTVLIALAAVSSVLASPGCEELQGGFSVTGLFGNYTYTPAGMSGSTKEFHKGDTIQYNFTYDTQLRPVIGFLWLHESGSSSGNLHSGSGVVTAGEGRKFGGFWDLRQYDNINSAMFNRFPISGSWSCVDSALPFVSDSQTTVAHNSLNNILPLNITGDAADVVSIVSNATHGSTSVNGTAITYSPNQGFGGVDTLTYVASNASGDSVTGTVTITVGPPTVTIDTDLSDATAAADYSAQLATSGGTAPYGYSVTAGALPDGLALAPDGLISGAPTVAGTFTFTVTAADALGFVGTRAFDVVVNTGASQTALSSSPNPSAIGAAVTLTASVTAQSAVVQPTGGVEFFDGATPIGTASVSNGIATLIVDNLGLGSHSLVARYSGDNNVVGSVSGTLQQQVNTPLDSVRLRAMQVLATQLAAQTSGQAFGQAIEGAISDGFSDSSQLAIQPGQIQFNYADSTVGDDIPWPGSQSAKPIGGSTNVWGRLQGVGVGSWAANGPGSTDVSGLQLNAFGGLGYRLTPDLLIGVMGGYEAFNYTSTSLNARLDGQGGTVGVYSGVKLGGGVRAFGGIGYSEITYNGAAGEASGNFNGHRWIMTGGIDGVVDIGNFVVTPSANLFVLSEDQDQYSDSLGTAHAARSMLTGNVSAGVKISHPLNYNGVEILPYGGLYADVSTAQNNEEMAGFGLFGDNLSKLLNSGITARAITGMTINLEDGTVFGISSSLGGIGGGTQTWGVNVNLAKSF